MTMSVEAAAQALREATRETVRRYSTWYLIQGVLMVLARNRCISLPLCIDGRPSCCSRLAIDSQRCRSRYQPNRGAKRSELLASIGIGCPVNNCRRDLPSPPRRSGCYPDAPFDCLLYGGGFREVNFFAHDTAASELGLGFSKRHYRNTTVSLSFD
jgi:hypothetical protein